MVIPEAGKPLVDDVIGTCALAGIIDPNGRLVCQPPVLACDVSNFGGSSGHDEAEDAFWRSGIAGEGAVAVHVLAVITVGRFPVAGIPVRNDVITETASALTS